MKKDHSVWIEFAIGLVLLLLLLGILWRVFLYRPEALKEFRTQIGEYHREYISEPAAGDWTEVYSFFFWPDKPLADFRPVDEALDRDFTMYFGSEIESGRLGSSELYVLWERIQLLRKEEDLMYLQKEEGEKVKIYLYSPGRNMGYCFLSVR